MGFEEAASNVGQGNGIWIVILALLGGGTATLGSLIEGKTKGDCGVFLKWDVICLLLSPILIGWILACCIACKTKAKSDG